VPGHSYTMEEVTAEISGPVLAAFHHKFGESQADFLAILLGCVSVQNYKENSDLATQTEKRKVRVVVEDWVMATMEKVMDFKTGELNKEALKSIVEGKKDLKFVGMLKFKKTTIVDMTPSFLDRKLIAAVLASCSWSNPRPHLYLLVGEEVTSTLSMKYSMATFLLEHEKRCLEGPWSKKIPLVVPNLGTDQRMVYMQGGGGGSKALKEMMEGSGLEKACVVDVDKNFQPLSARFKAGMEIVSDKVIELENSKAVLDNEVMILKQKLNERLQMTREMKMVRGLQGDLKTALEVAWEEVADMSRDSPDMFEEKININGDMENLELSGDEEEEEEVISGVSNQSY